MKNIFNSVQLKAPGRNHFDLSHDRKFSLKVGQLVPVFVQEVLPGDRFNVQSTQMIRFAPLVAPAMHRFDVFTHYFFVPNRILWNNWEPFITGGRDGNLTPAVPTVNIPGGTEMPPGSIGDYLGLPSITPEDPIPVSAFPLAALIRIFNEYYRDPNLTTEIEGSDLTDGNNAGLAAYLTSDPFLRCWEHDYFTSALPWTQRGPEATIPLGQTADVNYVPTAEDIVRFAAGNPDAGEPVAGEGALEYSDNTLPEGTLISNAGDIPVNLDNSANLRVDLSTATAATINSLRRAFALQRFLEKAARGGGRYVENTLAFFGVKSSDQRLQRPEYLGGGKSAVSISEVLQTSSTDEATTPQANMAGHGINVGRSHAFSYRAEEHGYIIGIQSVMPKPAYQQGIPRHFSRQTRLDYFWPEFAHIGEQEILSKELYADGTEGDNTIFGYTPRYAEYRYAPSTVHGEFRTSLNFWHAGRIFANRPQLNNSFLECTPQGSSERIFAVQGDVENLYCHVFFDVSAKRPIPKWGIPI